MSVVSALCHEPNKFDLTQGNRPSVLTGAARAGFDWKMMVSDTINAP
jgi:hypothetical protein